MKKTQHNKVFGNALRTALSSKSKAEREKLMSQKESVSGKSEKPNKEHIARGAKRNQFGVRHRTTNKRAPAKGQHQSSEGGRHGLEMEVETFCSALDGVQEPSELSFFFANLLLSEHSKKRIHLVSVPSDGRSTYVVARKDIVFVLNEKVYALIMPREMAFGEHRIRYALRTVLQKCGN